MPLRFLGRTRLATASVVTTLAVAMGISVPLFNAVVLLNSGEPDGVGDPAQLVGIGARNYVQYRELALAIPLMPMAVYAARSMSIGNGGERTIARVECVSSNYFSVLDVRLLGRSFSDSGGATDSAAEVVLSHRFWVQRFGGSAEVLGTSHAIAGRSFQIVGVAPAPFTGVSAAAVDAWIPIAAAPGACSGTGSNLLASGRDAWLSTVGRLPPDTTFEKVQSEIRKLARARFEDQAGGAVEPIGLWRRGSIRREMSLSTALAAGAVALLMIAWTNVGSLLGVRVHDLRRDLSVRLQLGATRWRLVTDLLREGALIYGVSCVGAVVLASWIWRLLPYAMPALQGKPFVTGRLAFILLAVVLSSFASLFAPTLRLLRFESASLFRSASLVSVPRFSGQRPLLIVQFSLAMVLVTGAGLFLRSLVNVRSSVGYDINNVVAASVDFTAAGITRESAQRVIWAEIASRIQQLPGLGKAAFTSVSPLGTAPSTVVMPAVQTEGLAPLERIIEHVSPSYFSVVGTRILRGRSFSEIEDSGDVVIVDEQLAQRMWPGEDVLGRCVTEVSLSGGCVVIVGISESRRLQRLGRVAGEIFLPLPTSGGVVPQTLFIQTSVDASQAVPGIVAALRAVPDFPVVSVRPLADLVGVQSASWITGTVAFSLFGIVAVALAALGLYSALALETRHRTAEFGVRFALGASRRQVAGLIARQAATTMVLAWTAGVLTALGGAAVMQRQLFGVAPTDVPSVLLASVILGLAGVAGALVPAVRAARVDPLVAMREP